MYYSFTGNTAKVAEDISRILSKENQVTVSEIKPVKQRSYFRWLLYSFMRNSKVKISAFSNDISKYDLVILGSPKWGLSCPPVNEYINTLEEINSHMFGVYLTYGGFGERNFLLQLVEKLDKKGAIVISKLLVKRGTIGNKEYYEMITSFCEDILKTTVNG